MGGGGEGIGGALDKGVRKEKCFFFVFEHLNGWNVRNQGGDISQWVSL